MPHNTPCPRCSEVSRVRVEHVIQGGKSYRSCECDACAHQWLIVETGEHMPSRGAADLGRPDRSRSRAS